MSLRLNSANSEVALINTTLPRDDFTLMCWYYPLTLSGWRNIFYTHAVSDGPVAQSYGTTLYSNGVSGSTLAAETWYHIALVNNAGTNHLVYLNGALDITDTSRNIDGGAWAYLQIGRWEASSDYANGRFASIKVFSAALTADEIKREMYNIRPVNYADIFSWHPTFPGSGERVRDYSGSGYDLTEVNTLTDEDPPPVSWGAPVWTVIEQAGGGTEEAAVSPISLALTVLSVTATYIQVGTAVTSPIQTTINIVGVTANYTQVETASITPLGVTLTLPDATASHLQVVIGDASPVQMTLAVVSVSASYVQVETASVSPLAIALAPIAATANGVQISTASVSPIQAVLTVVSVTATYIQIETASVSPIGVVFTIASVSVLSSGTADADPLQISISIASVTATYVQVNSAIASPLGVSLSPIDVTAAYAQVNSASASPLRITVSPVAPTANYIQVESASVVPLAMLIAIVSVTAREGGATFDFANMSIVFNTDRQVGESISNTVSISEARSVEIE